MESVFILLGTNLGDRTENLVHAEELIRKFIGTILNASAVYRTAAWGKTDQPDFYNRVILVSTALQPEPLLDSLLGIEQEMGRQRREKWGQRLIDLDILFYGSQIWHSAVLNIPHPHIASRRFTLAPLAEIAPDFVHPTLNKPIKQLLLECPDPLEVSKL